MRWWLNNHNRRRVKQQESLLGQSVSSKQTPDFILWLPVHNYIKTPGICVHTFCVFKGIYSSTKVVLGYITNLFGSFRIFWLHILGSVVVGTVRVTIVPLYTKL